LHVKNVALAALQLLLDLICRLLD